MRQSEPQSMSGLISELSAFGVFLGIASIGFLFLLISLVFGEIFEHLGVDADHSFDHSGPSFLSVRGISVFVTAFGGIGAIGIRYGMSTTGASAAGVGGGMVFAYIIYAFARFLYGQQASSSLSSTDVVGQTARVTVAIPAGGLGQVRCRVGEELVDKIARSRSGEAIAENVSVRVEEVLGETVIVSRPS
jgi:membrane protein implicated in regulation of membrane protease activity